MDENEKNCWVEASIREIWTQAHFAEISYKNIKMKSATPTDTAFTSIHSFLSHCAMLSKLLKSKYQCESGEVISIDVILGINATSVIHKRRFRNHLEHYDERLKVWVKKFASGKSIGTYNIGSKPQLDDGNMIFVSHYDPETNIYTFVDEDIDLEELYAEALVIREAADAWVSEYTS